MKFRNSLLLLFAIATASCVAASSLPVQWFDAVSQFGKDNAMVGTTFGVPSSVKTTEDFAKLLNQKFGQETLETFEKIAEESKLNIPKIEKCNDLFGISDPAVIDKVNTFAMHDCLAFKAISEMKPSKVSYLPKVPFDESTIKALPTELAPEGISDFSSIDNFKVLDFFQEVYFEIKGTVYNISIKPLAKGDFDGDGVEDILISVDSEFAPGSSGEGGKATNELSIFVLTKKSKDGKIEVVKTLYQQK
ncbi:MAG: hypothetical protein LBG61_02155 [Burkholderiales bacterium]|jgi:hypothetical protein|nr:hypothetical protein [Burkholderiales bacterium]